MVVITMTYEELVNLSEEKQIQFNIKLREEKKGTVNISFGENRVFNWDYGTKTIYNITPELTLGIPTQNNLNFSLMRVYIMKYVKEKRLKQCHFKK
jgi:hypothetical protein